MPPNLQKNLESKLKKSSRIAILGVGSEFRGDDAAGLLVIHQIKKKSKTKVIKIFEGATAPENLTGEIIKFKPNHILIIDSANFCKIPGTIKILDSDQIEGVSFSTHQLPLKMMVTYLEKSAGCEVTVIGIQPKKIDFDAPVSPQVQKAVKALSKTISKIINK